MTDLVLAAIYVVGLVPAALALYPLAVRDRMASPEVAAVVFAFFWPLLLAGAVLVAPFAALSRFVLWFHTERRGAHR